MGASLEAEVVVLPETIRGQLGGHYPGQPGTGSKGREVKLVIFEHPK